MHPVLFSTSSQITLWVSFFFNSCRLYIYIECFYYVALSLLLPSSSFYPSHRITYPPPLSGFLRLICSSHSYHDCALVGLNNYLYDSISRTFFFFFPQGGQFYFYFFLTAVFLFFFFAMLCEFKKYDSLYLVKHFIITSILFIYIFSLFFYNVRYNSV